MLTDALQSVALGETTANTNRMKSRSNTPQSTWPSRRDYGVDTMSGFSNPWHGSPGSPLDQAQVWIPLTPWHGSLGSPPRLDPGLDSSNPLAWLPWEPPRPDPGLDLLNSGKREFLEAGLTTVLLPPIITFHNSLSHRT